MTIGTRRPSPALIVAIIALVAALTGSALALPGKNTVQSNDIKKNAVKSKHLKNDGVKGIDVDESSLSKVPSAAQADQAAQAANADSVGGARVVPFTGFIPANSGPTAVLNVGGFTISATCSGGPVLTDLVATTTANDGFIASVSVDPGGEVVSNGETDDSFASGEEIDLISDNNDELHFTTYFDDGTGAGGTQLRAEYAAGYEDGSSNENPTGCYVVGTADVF